VTFFIESNELEAAAATMTTAAQLIVVIISISILAISKLEFFVKVQTRKAVAKLQAAARRRNKEKATIRKEKGTEKRLI